MSSTDNPVEPRLGAQRSRYGQMVAAFRHADFRVLWLSTVPSEMGQGMQQVLFGWLVLQMTGSIGLVGVIYALRSAPNLIVGFPAGSISDRLDRRVVMQVATWGLMVVALVVALLLYTDRLELWHLMLSAFLLGAFQTFYQTARQVYVYDIVGASGAINGIGLIYLAQRSGGFIGALLAGVVIQFSGSATAFLAMGIGYILAVIAMYGLRLRGEAAPQSPEPIWQNILGYLGALKTNRVMQSLMVATVAAEILGYSHEVMLPVLAREVLDVGAVGLGVLVAFRSIGGVLGVFGLVGFGEVRRRGMLLLAVLVMFGAGVVMLSQSPNLWVALLFVTFISMMSTATDILFQTLLQLSVPNDLRGRAMGAYRVGVGTGPVGQLEIGYLAAATTARLALLANGVTLAALPVALWLFLPRLRSL